MSLEFKISKVLWCFNILWLALQSLTLFSSSTSLYYGHKSVSCLFLMIQLFKRRSDLKRLETDSELEKMKTLEDKQKKKKCEERLTKILMGWCKLRVRLHQAGAGNRKDICFLASECLAYKFQNKISHRTCLIFGIYFSCSCTSLAVRNEREWRLLALMHKDTVEDRKPNTWRAQKPFGTLCSECDRSQ